MTFGPGLTNAYLMEEKNAKYPRIILTKEVLLNTYRNDLEKEHILTTAVFKDFDAFYAVNYFGLISTAVEEIYQNIEHTIDYVLDTTTDSSIREKYIYFERMLRERVKRINSN